MIIQYESPYHKMLAELMKDDELPEIEQKIFNALVLADDFLTRQSLVEVVFGRESKRTRRAKKELEDRIREGVEFLQDRAVPIYILRSNQYRLGNNLNLIVETIQDFESKIRCMQDRVDMVRVYYTRQLEPFEKIWNESKKST